MRMSKSQRAVWCVSSPDDTGSNR